MCKNSPSQSAAKVHGKQQYTSGFVRHTLQIQIGIATLSAVYGCVYYLNPKIEVQTDHCTNDDLLEDGSCRRADLLAFKAASFVAMLAMGFLGVYHWHFSAETKRLAVGAPSSCAEDRLFGYLASSNAINVVIFCYQVCDFTISLFIPEHLDFIFLTHHILAIITAFCSLHYQMGTYYSIFYGGCSEFSSIFLIFLDKDEIFVVTPGSLMDKWIMVCKVAFFLSFTYYRVIGWIFYGFQFNQDCFKAISSGTAEAIRPGITPFLRLFQVLNFLLGALQCYWFYKIIGTVVDMFTAILG